MARKSVFDSVGGYNEASYAIRVEDYDIFMRMKAKGAKMEVIQEILFDYRDDKDNSIRRKKYKYRVNEFIVRVKGFRKLHLFPKSIVYSFKPLIVGLIPISIIRKIRERQ